MTCSRKIKWGQETWGSAKGGRGSYIIEAHSNTTYGKGDGGSEEEPTSHLGELPVTMRKWRSNRASALRIKRPEHVETSRQVILLVTSKRDVQVTVSCFCRTSGHRSTRTCLAGGAQSDQ